MVRRNHGLLQSHFPIKVLNDSRKVEDQQKSWGSRDTVMKPVIFFVVVLVNATCLATVSSAKLPVPTYDIKKDGTVGNIGCLFSKTLCDQDLEWCYDDLVFGRCLSTTGVINENDMYRYELSKGEMHSLEKQMERLFAMGYRWGHSYTQCVLRNLLESFRRGGELDESICLDVQDQDLEGALKAFQEDIDPWNLAFIKFNPSSKNPHSNFADESYRPPKDLSHLGNGDVVAGKELLANEASQIRIQDRLRQPVLELSAPDVKLLEEAVVDPYLVEQELESTVAKVKGANSKGKNKSGKNKNKNKNKPKNTKKSVLNVEYPGQSDNFNGVDIGSAKKDPAGMGWTDPINLREGLGYKEAASNGIGPDGFVNDRILQPRIFSNFYNTPNSFRHGIEESWNEPDQALGNEIRPDDMSLLGLVGDGISSAVGGGYETAPGYSNDDIDHRARQEELSRRQEEEDQQTREAVATLQAAALLEYLLRDENNLEDDFRNAEVEELEGLPITGQLLPSASLPNNLESPYGAEVYPSGVLNSPPGLDDGNLLYTEGGLVFLNNRENNNPDPSLSQGDIFEEQEGLNFLKRFANGPEPQELDQESWVPLQLDQAEDGSLIAPVDSETGFGNENYGYDYSSPLFLLNRRSRNGFSFERRERLDVKKPGPWYRTVNNYAFDKDDNQEQKMGRSHANGEGKFGFQDVNPEFGAAEGPADMVGDRSLNEGWEAMKIQEDSLVESVLSLFNFRDHEII